MCGLIRCVRGRFVVGVSVLTLLLAACDSKPSTPPVQPAAPNVEQTAAPEKPVAEKPAPTAAPAKLPPPAIPAAAKLAPAQVGQPTGTFIDRPAGADVRLVSFNILWNNIFVETNAQNADRFVRIMRALNPDVLALQEIGVTSWMLKDNPNARHWNADDVAYLMDTILPLANGAHWQAFMGSDCVLVSRYPLKMTATETIPAGERDLAMALVDLPDAQFGIDLYVLDNHFKCCDPAKNDVRRQEQADSIVAWLRDAREPGGHIDLPAGTGMVVCGDLNLVGSFQPAQTLIDGNIEDEQKYGADSPPDWDGTALTDAHPLHNIIGPDDYTWRNDDDKYDPGRIDFIFYTDSVLNAVKTFALDTLNMSDEDLHAAGLEKLDVATDATGHDIDHYPLVVDFEVRSAAEKN